jgi:hypothetical protein
LQEWYSAHCDGDWEHTNGVSIGTIDNPGWSVGIDLKGTSAHSLTMAPYKNDLGDDDWIVCQAQDGRFSGLGDPTKLTAILECFRQLVTP